MAYINGKEILFSPQVHTSGGSGEWDYIVRDVMELEDLNVCIQKENARVFVAVHFKANLTYPIGLPGNVKFIDFGGCTYGDGCQIEIMGEGTHIRNLYLDQNNMRGSLKISRMSGVEYCGCNWYGALQNSQVTISFEDCNNISNCVATNMMECSMVTNCYLGSDQKVSLVECYNVSNITVFGEMEAQILNCNYVYNVRKMPGSTRITYTGCNNVSRDTCDDYSPT